MLRGFIMKSNIKKIIVLLTIILIVLLCVICYIKYSKNFDSNNFYEDEIKDSKVEKEDNNLKNHFKLLGVKANPYPFIKDCDIYVQTSKSEGFVYPIIS